MTRPNILLIHADQHRFDCLGANSHPILQTPHLDRLAREGINFQHAYTPIPVCTPARNSLLYGCWPSQHRVIANANTEPAHPTAIDRTTFSRLLQASGYRLGYVGKWGVHPHQTPLDHGFADYHSERDYPAWRAARGLPPPPDLGWQGGIDSQAGPADSRLAWGADQTLHLLDEYAARQTPFFLRWDPPEPHLPNIVPEPYAGRYPPADIPPWPSFPDPLAGKPYIQAQQRRTWRVDGWTWADWAPIVSRYLGQISLLDAQVGRLLDYLDRSGLTSNTLVIYTTDHGDLCGGHGMVDKHYVMYDDVVRVPLLVRWPGVVSPGRRCQAFISHELDLAATFCDLAGLPIPPEFSGCSLLPLLQGETTDGRPDIFATYHGNQFGLYSQRMVRDRRWKYIWNATAEDELYDLQTDPGELHNRAREQTCQSEVTRLRERLLDWMQAVADPLLNGWTERQLRAGLTI